MTASGGRRPARGQGRPVASPRCCADELGELERHVRDLGWSVRVPRELEGARGPHRGRDPHARAIPAGKADRGSRTIHSGVRSYVMAAPESPPRCLLPGTATG